uniref:Uncharacterized protein n=1 Tax=Panagrolaimus superbus TaxID=310955 RepID=A0A914Y674_9BILA
MNNNALISFDKSLQKNPCQLQAFSLPSNLIYYISKNPLFFSVKVYQKLIQTCKYFYLKKRIIVINKLESSQNPFIWEAYEKLNGKEYIKLDIRNLSFDLWLIGELNVCRQIPAGFVNLLLQKVVKCDITSIYLYNYMLNFNEFLVLTESKKIKHLALEEIIVRDNDGKVVPYEDILQRVPNVSYCA